MGIEDDVFGPQKDRERRAAANPVDCMVRVPTEDRLFSAEYVREIILDRIKELGSQKAFAEDAGVSVAYVNDYVHFRREPGASLLEAVGMVMVKRYARIEP